MAQIINTNTNYGLFNAGEVEMTALTDSAFSADVSECKDAIAVLLDVPASAGEIVLTCLYADSGEGVGVKLVSGKLNAVYITTHGLKKQDGSADFKLATSDGGEASASGIKVGFLKYVSVISR